MARSILACLSIIEDTFEIQNKAVLRILSFIEDCHVHKGTNARQITKYHSF